MHKDADQLISEVEEICKELGVYETWKKELLSSLDGLMSDYKKKRFSYSEYERKLASLLNGRTKDEWIDYYDAYQYSLLKRVEFILAQSFEIVKDDRSSVKFSAASPVKGPVQAPIQQEKRKDVFNIDNEILRLKQLLHSHYSQPEVKAAVRGIDLSIPELKDIKEEISRDEVVATEASEQKKVIAHAAAENAEKNRVAEQAAKKTMEVQVNAVPKQPVKKRFLSVRLPKLNVNSLKLNLSPKEAMRELSSARAVIIDFFGKLSKLKVVKKTEEPASQEAFPSKGKKELISFTDLLDTAKERPKQKATVQKTRERIGLFSSLKSALSPKQKKIFVEDIVSMERSAKSEKEESRLVGGEAGIAFGWFSPKRLLSEFTGHFSKKQEPILAETTAVPLHMKKLREMRKRLYQEERLSGFDATLLAQEARRIKRILEVEKQEVYKGSSLGLIANVTVRKISLFLVNNFPQFFGYLYNALRAANVKVLSNTYVNIMVLVTMALTAAVFFLLLVFFFAINYPLYQIFLRSVIFSLVAGLLCATIFYSYPFIKIRERRRKTTTNLPFAINHMSAVSSSGVPPARMFELIAESDEYEEVGVELKKIVDFINIFGYDLLTAIKAVASTTPSLPFKKFLEGMVSTIETGGDLVSYLRQQADEAALTYKLERQRYNETVSTYSDIYTGVLIAAPLFFIAAMALVNMLGGSLGGLGVGVVMALGAYVAIPVLNIGFIIFLQMTQPEV